MPEADFAALRASVADLPGTVLLTETLSRADIYALEAACAGGRRKRAK